MAMKMTIMIYPASLGRYWWGYIHSSISRLTTGVVCIWIKKGPKVLKLSWFQINLPYFLRSLLAGLTDSFSPQKSVTDLDFRIQGWLSSNEGFVSRKTPEIHNLQWLLARVLLLLESLDQFFWTSKFLCQFQMISGWGKWVMTKVSYHVVGDGREELVQLVWED